MNIKLKKTSSAARLDGACYLYLLKDESDTLSDLRSHLSTMYEPSNQDKGGPIDLENFNATHYYLTKKEASERLDVHIHNIGNIYAVSLVSFKSKGDKDVLTGLADLLGGCREKLTSSKSSILGDALVLVAADPLQNMERVKQVAGLGSADISAKRNGRNIHQIISQNSHQYFLIEDSSPASIHDLVAKELPLIGWAIRRLQREWSYYNDRVEVILKEKQEIDDELSKILHQKVASTLSSGGAEALEDQIGRLSSMYSVLATNLHLVKGASTILDKDLVLLGRRASAFEGADDSFPQYHVAYFQDKVKLLHKLETDLHLSLDNTKAAIDIAQTQTEILRGAQGLALQEQTRELLNQNVALQDERMSLQVAAHVVELVVIFYYTLKSWEAVAVAETVATLPPYVKFGIVALFSGSVVALTHYIGAGLHKHRFLALPVLATVALVILSLAAMIITPGLWHN